MKRTTSQSIEHYRVLETTGTSISGKQNWHSAITLISECDYDFICMTDIGLSETDAASIDNVISVKYYFRHLPRSDRRGGGVDVILIKASYKLF